MNAETIVEEARALGINLSATGDKIQFSPKSRTPADFVEMLRQHKKELLVYLSQGREEGLPSDSESIIGWASELAEHCLVLSSPVTYIETPLRTMTTRQVSSHASRHLKTIHYAWLQQRTGGWHLWTPEWWREREKDALGALQSLREAMEGQAEKGGQE